MKLSNKRSLYDKDKPKAGIKIELANHDSMILEITEDWDNEDLYAAIQERSNESSWELQGGLQLQPIECNHTKIFKAGYAHYSSTTIDCFFVIHFSQQTILILIQVPSCKFPRRILYDCKELESGRFFSFNIFCFFIDMVIRYFRL